MKKISKLRTKQMNTVDYEWVYITNYIYHADLRNDKISTLRKLEHIQLPRHRPFFLLNSAFKKFVRNEDLSDIKKEIFQIASLLLKNASIVVRSAPFRFDTVTTRMQPIYSGIQSGKALLDAVLDIYRQMVDRGWTGSNDQILALIIHRFVASISSGTIAPLYQNGKVCFYIDAIWGIWEGIQIYPHDSYLVEFDLKIVSKEIREKSKYIDNDWRIKRVPNGSTSQVLDDKLIARLCVYFKRLVEQYGFHRVEFMIKEDGSPLLWHAQPIDAFHNYLSISHKIEPLVTFKKTGNEIIHFEGRLLPIFDYSKVKTSGKTALLVGSSYDRTWFMENMATIAASCKKYNMPVINIGSRLSHIAIQLKENGIKVYNAVHQPLDIGETYIIYSN